MSSYLSSSTYKGAFESIPSGPPDVHLAAIRAAREKHSGRIFIVYIGQADNSGNSWCGDCNDIKKVLSNIPSENSILLECQVTRDEWKVSPGSAHPLRSQRFLPVGGVPCLMKMGESRPIAALTESDILDETLLLSLIEV